MEFVDGLHEAARRPSQRRVSCPAADEVGLPEQGLQRLRGLSFASPRPPPRFLRGKLLPELVGYRTLDAAAACFCGWKLFKINELSIGSQCQLRRVRVTTDTSSVPLAGCQSLAALPYALFTCSLAGDGGGSHRRRGDRAGPAHSAGSSVPIVRFDTCAGGRLEG